LLAKICSTLSAGDMCPGDFACGSSGRDMCRETVEKYRAAISTVTDDEGEELAGSAVCCRNESDEGPEDEAQTLKHVVLLLFLLCSMFVVCET
jgi:hypothetical protein